MKNYYGIALRSSLSNLVAMKSAYMASIYHICGYHYNCTESADAWCHYQKDKQDNTHY